MNQERQANEPWLADTERGGESWFGPVGQSRHSEESEVLAHLGIVWSEQMPVVSVYATRQATTTPLPPPSKIF